MSSNRPAAPRDSDFNNSEDGFSSWAANAAAEAWAPLPTGHVWQLESLTRQVRVTGSSVDLPVVELTYANAEPRKAPRLSDEQTTKTTAS